MFRSARPLWDRVSFVDPAFLACLGDLSAEGAMELPHGVVKLDDAGLVQIYNRWESEMAGVPIAAALGKNFFTELAPCTKNRLFHGRFEDGVRSGDLDVSFDYTFTYRMRPAAVAVHLYRHRASATNWILLRKT